MEKFNRTLRGYDPEEVNNFLDQVIVKVERMVAEIEEKDREIALLKAQQEDVSSLTGKVKQYEKMEDTLNRAIIMAEKTSDQIKTNAYQERDMILENAKKNATRIVNEALLRAEKTEQEASMLRRNVNIFKRRLKEIVETQLDVIDDIDKVDF